MKAQQVAEGAGVAVYVRRFANPGKPLVVIETASCVVLDASQVGWLADVGVPAARAALDRLAFAAIEGAS